MDRKMKILIWSLLIVSNVTVVSSENMQLVFEDTFDEFNKSKWDQEVTMWGGGNWEFQTYTADPVNTYVRNNTLFIRPTLTKDSENPLTKKPYGEDFLYNGVWDMEAMYGRCTMAQFYGCHREGKHGILNPIMSGRIRTHRRFSFRFGRVEVVAKMPVGDWMWPAIWFLPEDMVYGEWPRSGEIDLVEARGNRDLKNSEGYIGIQRVGSALHWGPRYDVNKYSLTLGDTTNTSSNYGDYFHKYTLDWDENGLRFAVDDKEYLRVPNPPINENKNWKGFYEYAMENGGFGGFANPWKDRSLMAPFDQKFHILINVAVGGTTGYFPDDVINNGTGSKPWRNTGPGNQMDAFWKKKDEWYPTWVRENENAAMQVKSVRVYQKLSGTPDTTKAPATETRNPSNPCGNNVSSASRMLPLYLMLIADILAIFHIL